MRVGGRRGILVSTEGGYVFLNMHWTDYRSSFSSVLPIVFNYQ